MASRPRGPGHPMDPDVKLFSSALFASSVVCLIAGLSAPAAAADAGAASMSLHGDLMTPAVPENTTVQGALGSGSGDGHEPKVIYLRYADGSETHTSNYDACNTGKVPKFECTFAPTLVECQRQIQAYLDAWYADFNVIFTLTRPTSGKYYTEVVSSGGGAWCKVDDKVAGVAPFLCNDLAGGVAYTFQGGRNARETAVIIAQEQAHLVGLEHTNNAHDIMFPTISTDTMGFVDGDSPVSGDRCDRETQNSYRMMKKALGDWPGGPKPSAFGCMEDTQSPSVRFLSPGNGDKKGHAFAVSVDVHDDCDVKKVAISVMPQGLTAVAMAAPYEWDLTGINGAQTITVTATDGSGRTGSATLEVTAPETREELGPNESDGAGGCSVASGAFSAAGLVPSLAMFLLFSGKNRRSRLRRVPGALTR
jgi:hypothetical protein